MTYEKNTPEYLIPDNSNYFEKYGVEIRKGTMASAITNVEIIESSKSSTEDRKEAIEILKALVPFAALKENVENDITAFKNSGWEVIQLS